MVVHKHFQNYLRTLHESMLWRLNEERRKIACDFGQMNEATFIVWQFIVFDGFKKRAKMVVAEYYGDVSLQKEKHDGEGSDQGGRTMKEARTTGKDTDDFPRGIVYFFFRPLLSSISSRRSILASNIVRVLSSATLFRLFRSRQFVSL